MLPGGVCSVDPWLFGKILIERPAPGQSGPRNGSAAHLAGADRWQAELKSEVAIIEPAPPDLCHKKASLSNVAFFCITERAISALVCHRTDVYVRLLDIRNTLLCVSSFCERQRHSSPSSAIQSSPHYPQPTSPVWPAALPGNTRRCWPVAPPGRRSTRTRDLRQTCGAQIGQYPEARRVPIQQKNPPSLRSGGLYMKPACAGR